MRTETALTRKLGHRSGGCGWAGLAIGGVFSALASWFLWGPELLDIPALTPVAVDPARLTAKPRRKILGDPPVVNLDGFDRTCMDCHRLFEPREISRGRLLQHQGIRLEHGINDRCRNCHDVEDRNQLVLHGGGTITYGWVVELCAKCHGPTYRDWERGAHGRTNGYWDARRGEMRRLKCTECHDPHTPRIPAMDPIRPLPPPPDLAHGTARAA